jgi:hypothetical protein
MRRSPKMALQALMCIFLLVLPLPSLAEGDDTNAANITDLSLWADMYQVMSGASTTGTPDTLQQPLNIRTPEGIYAYVLVDDHLLTEATHSGLKQETALKNYFTFLLNQTEVAGILFAAPWSLLNPRDPATTAEGSSPYDWTPLKAAFEAIEDWNNNPDNSGPAKTLQLNVTAGFNSPPWIFDHLTSCDALFSQLNLTSTISCGYTSIFVQTEVASPGPAKLPLPWDTSYHALWKTFLQKLWSHINENNWQQDVVSVAVAGPTATSTEIILPNENDQRKYSPLQLPSPPTNSNIDALSAWNCLLANNYGVKSSYLNSNRAFIEEWANAIDMFGEIFSELTLVVTTGNGLPNFNLVPDPAKPGETSSSGCGLHGVKLPDLSASANSNLLKPHPAFESDCGTAPLRPMDCPAEVAILAYFAEPPVVGPNAKAIQENALSASDDNVGTLLSLSNASVKWLAQESESLTLVGPQPDIPPPATGLPLVSRILGGLQFNHAASTPATTAKQGCPELEASPGFCNPDSSHPKSYHINPEQAIRNTLKVFFAGASGGGASAFSAPGTIKNNDLPIKDAPLNYLQIWAADIVYASGFGGCATSVIMKNPAPSTTLSCYKTTSTLDLLVNASKHIPTTDPVVLPLFGYNQCSNKKQVPTCKAGLFQRDAFQGDLVCVSKAQKNQADAQSDPKTYGPNFSLNDSKSGIAYGRCKSGFVWRQAYMGDYVCVRNQQLLSENIDYLAGVGVDCH